MVSRCGPRVEKSPLIAFSHTLFSLLPLLPFVSTSSTLASLSCCNSLALPPLPLLLLLLLLCRLLRSCLPPRSFSSCGASSIFLSFSHLSPSRLPRAPHRRRRTFARARMSRDFSQTSLPPRASLSLSPSLRTYNVQLPEDQITRGTGEALHARYAITKPRSHWPTWGASMQEEADRREMLMRRNHRYRGRATIERQWKEGAGKKGEKKRRSLIVLLSARNRSYTVPSTWVSNQNSRCSASRSIFQVHPRPVGVVQLPLKPTTDCPILENHLAILPSPLPSQFLLEFFSIVRTIAQHVLLRG